MPGELLTIWTIRLALLCFAGAVAGRWFATQPRGLRLARGLWTAGCVLFVLHVSAAFHFYHGWSHAHAWQDTARQTQELLGVTFGDGIYFSYAFLAVWVADAFWWWAWPENYCRRARWLDGAILSYLLFIAFNGAAVFEGGVTRWGTVVFGLTLVALAWRRTAPSPLKSPASLATPTPDNSQPGSS